MDNILYSVSIDPKQPTADTITFYVKSATLPAESSNGIQVGVGQDIYKLQGKWKYNPIEIVFDDSSEDLSPLIKSLESKPFRFDMTINLFHSDYRAISCYELYDCYLDNILESSLDYTQSGTEITMRIKYNRYRFFALV